MNRIINYYAVELIVGTGTLAQSRTRNLTLHYPEGQQPYPTTPEALAEAFARAVHLERRGGNTSEIGQGAVRYLRGTLKTEKAAA